MPTKIPLSGSIVILVLNEPLGHLTVLEELGDLVLGQVEPYELLAGLGAG